MASIIISFEFDKFIGEESSASYFLKLLETYDMAPDKIGLYEPLKQAYSYEQAMEMWTKTEVGNGRIFGSMMGKKKNPTYSFIMEWNKGEKYTKPNWLTIFTSVKGFKDKQDVYMNIFKDVLEKFNGIYGFITHVIPEQRQHVPGSIETRLPGVFWCNYYSEIYINFFGREKVLKAPWESVEELSNGSIITFLTKEPDKDLIEDVKHEMNLKRYLGIDSFGDYEAYSKEPTLQQIKNVPKLELNSIRVSFSEGAEVGNIKF